MEAAIWSAGLQPQEIDYINAHATSTPAGDASEAEAIKQVFAGVAKKPVVSSTKSLTGHTLGAAGAIEAVFTCLAIQNSFIPPTINLENVDPVASELDLCHNVARPAELKYAMSNSFGFGGTNACLIFKKWEE
jgi:3-oxoacyl-[acyl-carrier-protein] synthase II